MKESEINKDFICPLGKIMMEPIMNEMGEMYEKEAFLINLKVKERDQINLTILKFVERNIKRYLEANIQLYFSNFVYMPESWKESLHAAIS
jgi:hypothetical protein